MTQRKVGARAVIPESGNVPPKPVPQLPTNNTPKTRVVEEPVEKIVVVEPKRAGRKAKPPEEKERNLVGLMLTDAEYENLKKRAGLAPAAAVLKDHLRRKTDLLKPVQAS